MTIDPTAASFSMTFLHPEFCTLSDCARFRRAIERGRASRAEIYAGGYRVDAEARCAFDVDVASETIEEVRCALDTIRPEVARFFGIPLFANEGPGFLRYVAGGFYRRHCDVAPGWDDDFPRRVSVVIFLTSADDQCEGGALRIYQPEPFDITPKAGMLVAFPSDVPHEVLPVTEGMRDVIVDWFY